MASVRSERRTNLEIIASILEACRRKTRKTRVLFQCNLSFKQFAGYLDLLLEAKLLLIERDRRYSLFRISRKGRRFLKAYNSMKAMMK